MPGITTLPVTVATQPRGDGDRVGQVGVLVLAWSAEEHLFASGKAI